MPHTTEIADADAWHKNTPTSHTTDITEADAQALADGIRDKINQANVRLGSNCMPLGRAFGAQ